VELEELMDTHHLELIRKVTEEIKAKKFSAVSTDGLVTVEVIAGGRIVGLDINPRVFRQPDSKGLAATILDTMNTAHEKAAQMQIESLNAMTAGGPASLQGLLDGMAELADKVSGKTKP
jgi:DNA-binding protein YbaB